MLPDLSVQLLNPFLLDLRTDPFFIDKLAELILNSHFNLLDPRVQDIINLTFYNRDVSLIEAPMLIKDYIHSFINHFFMLFHHHRVLKVFCNQFLCEITEEDVLFSLLKGGVLSEAYVAVGELPEFLRELEPGLESVGGDFLLTTGLHEV